MGLSHNQHGAIVLGLGFIHLGAWVANEDEHARFEIKVAYSVRVLSFELLCRCQMTLEDAVVDGSEVILALL